MILQDMGAKRGAPSCASCQLLAWIRAFSFDSLHRKDAASEALVASHYACESMSFIQRDSLMAKISVNQSCFIDDMP